MSFPPSPYIDRREGLRIADTRVSLSSIVVSYQSSPKANDLKARVTVRFLADEDIRSEIIRGLRSREPSIDILDVKSSGLRSTPDADLLELAAGQERIVISHDADTMTGHFCDRLRAGQSASVLFIISQEPGAVGAIIGWLLLVWAASQPEEWRDQISYFP